MLPQSNRPKYTTISESIDNWRSKIQTSMIIGRLNRHIKGELELKSTQINAAKILLDRVLPVLTQADVQVNDITTPRTAQEAFADLIRLYGEQKAAILLGQEQIKMLQTPHAAIQAKKAKESIEQEVQTDRAE